jgi:hypothetical protein
MALDKPHFMTDKSTNSRMFAFSTLNNGSGVFLETEIFPLTNTRDKLEAKNFVNTKEDNASLQITIISNNTCKILDLKIYSFNSLMVKLVASCILAFG